jgi:hypothetical protein
MPFTWKLIMSETLTDDRLWDLDERLMGMRYQLHGKHNQKKHGVRRARSGKQWTEGLSASEYNALGEWTSIGSVQMRKYIAGGKVSKTEQKDAEVFLSAINKSPAYKQTAYRGMTFNSEREKKKFVKDVVKGKGMEETSVSSFTKRRMIAKDEFTDDPSNSVLLKVKMKTGADISSFNSAEMEVLSLKGTQFRLTKVTEPQRAKKARVGMPKAKAKVQAQMRGASRPLTTIELEEI